MVAQKQRAIGTTHKKRHGQHHKQGKHYLKVYWPYVPMLLLVLIGLVVGNWNPRTNHGVLAYATEMNVNSLLSNTNSERAANGQAALSLNSKLTNAAQAKANDMTARNYWSHNTPEGNPPWVFVDAEGYSYLKAGENLAYGFNTSSDTITGWMNSAGHRANMLDSGFTEVGFGFANSANYNSSGPETVVVAMYGKPQVESANTSAAPAAAPTTPSSPTPAPTQATPAPETTAASPTPAPTEPTKADTAKDTATKPTDQPVTTAAPILAEPASQPISHLQTLTAGQVPWATFAVGLGSGLIIMTILLRHGLAFRKLVTEGEEFILHHPWADIALVGLLMVGYVLTQASGVIK